MDHLTEKQLFISRKSLGGKLEWTEGYQFFYLGDALIMIQTQAQIQICTSKTSLRYPVGLPYEICIKFWLENPIVLDKYHVCTEVGT